MRRILRSLAGSLLLALTAATPALAGTVSNSSGWTYTGGGGITSVRAHFYERIIEEQPTTWTEFVEGFAMTWPSAPMECEAFGGTDYRSVLCPTPSGPITFNLAATSDNFSSGTYEGAQTLPLVVRGNAGHDTLSGNARNDTLDGGPDDDTLDGKGGNDSLIGGDGDDTVRVFEDDTGAAVTASLATHSLSSASNGVDTIGADVENLFCHCFGGATLTGDGGPNSLEASNTSKGTTLNGGGGNDDIEGSLQNDQLNGGDGDDVLRGDGGTDVFDGGSGNDEIAADYGTPGDVIHCGDGLDKVYADPGDIVDADCEQDGVLITAGPTGTTPQRSATFEFSHVGPSSGQFQCRLDASGFSACASPKTYDGLSEGAHTFGVRFVPTGQPATAEATRSWTVDSSAPEVRIDSAPSGPDNGSDATITFSSSEPDGATFRCSLDNGPAEGCASPHRLLGLADGPHTFTVTTTDKVGNESAAVTVAWSVGHVEDQQTPVECPAGAVAEVKFGVIVARAAGGPQSCFAVMTVDGDPVQASTGAVKINGVLVVPELGSLIVVDRPTDGGRVKTTGAVTLKFGDAELPVPRAFTWSGLDTTAANKVVSIVESHLTPEGSSGPAEFLGLKVTAAPSLTLTTDNGGEAKVAFKVAMPAFFSALPATVGGQSQGLTLEFGFTTSNDKGVSLQAKGKIDEAYVFGKVKLKDLEVAFDSAGPYLDGAASLELTTPRIGLTADTELRLAVQLGPNGILGALRKFSLQASNVNKLIGSAVFLQRLGVEFSRVDSPAGLQATGSGGISLGPHFELAPIFDGEVIALDGTLKLVIPSGAAPWSLEAAGTEKVIEFPVASASVNYVHGQRLELGGRVDQTIGGFGLLVTILPETTWVSWDDLNLEARGDLRLPTGFGTSISRDAQFIESTLGFAACFGTEGSRTGIAKRWGQPLQTFASTCDVAPLRVAAPAAAQAGAVRAVTVEEGTTIEVLRAQGAAAPPEITITGPQAKTTIVRDAAQNATYAILEQPTPGRYVVAGDLTELRAAPNLPPVRVSASVRRAGARRLLRWRLTPQPGQRVRFVDHGPAGARVLAQTTRSRGSRRFALDPTSGDGLHRIEAVVVQDGIPRTRRTVATFQQARVVPAKVRGLRRHGRKLRWRRAPGAATYALALTARGVTSAASTAKPRLRLTKRQAGKKLKVTIVGLDALGRAGRPVTRQLCSRRRCLRSAKSMINGMPSRP